MTQPESILRFLREHRGELFCAGCLRRKLFGTRRVTPVAILKAEGGGARRVQGVCSACGKRRVVAGLPKAPSPG